MTWIGVSMRVVDNTVGELTERQLENLCDVVGINKSMPVQLVRELLGPVASRPLSEPPMWPSDVADDATPLEFSVQFEDNAARLRVLGETVSARPSMAANLGAAKDFLTMLTDRLDLALDRLHAVQDLFSPDQPQGLFSWWFSLIFDAQGKPALKVYFNTDVRGAHVAPQLVAEAFDRLGMADAYDVVNTHALWRGSDLDRLTFFAIDLDDSPQARVKIYIRQHEARPDDVQFAASAVPGIDPALVGQFCSLLAPTTEVFGGRPLMSSYSFVEDDVEKPSNYSIYLPIRDYAPNDAVARERVSEHLRQHSVNPTVLDSIISALTDRPLHARGGLLAHVSLRLSPSRTGTTIYLSSEAYGGTPSQD
jgi:hypothetical protein